SFMIVSQRCRSLPSKLGDDGGLRFGNAITGLRKKSVASHGAEIAGRYFLKKRTRLFPRAHGSLLWVEGNRISLLHQQETLTAAVGCQLEAESQKDHGSQHVDCRGCPNTDAAQLVGGRYVIFKCCFQQRIS